MKLQSVKISMHKYKTEETASKSALPVITPEAKPRIGSKHVIIQSEPLYSNPDIFPTYGKIDNTNNTIDASQYVIPTALALL
jgi:hypothetical protein